MKRTPLIAALLAASAAALTGCNSETKTQDVTETDVKTVNWYMEHEAERTAMLEKCDNNPGELLGTPDCLNADEAERKLRKAKLEETIEKRTEETKKDLQDALERYEQYQ